MCEVQERRLYDSLRRKCERKGMKLYKSRSRKDRFYLGYYWLLNERGVLVDENKHIDLETLAKQLAGA